MKRVNHAWVSGFKPIGYILHVVDSPATSEFAGLNQQYFTTLRAAQTLATAIKAYVRAQPTWTRRPYGSSP